MEFINQILQESANRIREALQQLQSESFIESLPSALIEDEEAYRRLPENVSAIYFLTHPFEELLYLGKANNLRTRWRPSGHTHDCLEPAIRLGQVKLSWWPLDVDILSVVEEVLIKSWRPQWNGGATDWIKRYRPEWNWPDDIADWQVADSERGRGRFTKGSASLREVWKNNTRHDMGQIHSLKRRAIQKLLEEMTDDTGNDRKAGKHKSKKKNGDGP